ncbi:NAD(P)H-binding protein [Streptomyces sp. NPDC001817]|uniref:NAD(P)H-binding protein n=1 Tax=Streptomyces sp. NPDC001817 TaxID=3154398 RepID=UPI00332E1651
MDFARQDDTGTASGQRRLHRSPKHTDWKRRSERLVRAGGLPYTIVWPGWFDGPHQHRPVFLKGETRRTGTPADGVIAREEIARVLVEALTAPHATGRTLALVAENGPAPEILGPQFEALAQDAAGALDRVGDQANMPLDQEPAPVREDLAAVRSGFAVQHMASLPCAPVAPQKRTGNRR